MTQHSFSITLSILQLIRAVINTRNLTDCCICYCLFACWLQTSHNNSHFANPSNHPSPAQTSERTDGRNEKQIFTQQKSKKPCSAMLVWRASTRRVLKLCFWFYYCGAAQCYTIAWSFLFRGFLFSFSCRNKEWDFGYHLNSLPFVMIAWLC